MPFSLHLFIEHPVHGKVLGAEVGAHVGFHEVEVELGVQHKVESNHLEETALLRVILQRISEFGLLGTTKICGLISKRTNRKKMTIEKMEN